MANTSIFNTTPLWILLLVHQDELYQNTKFVPKRRIAELSFNDRTIQNNHERRCQSNIFQLLRWIIKENICQRGFNLPLSRTKRLHLNCQNVVQPFPCAIGMLRLLRCGSHIESQHTRNLYNMKNCSMYLFNYSHEFSFNFKYKNFSLMIVDLKLLFVSHGDHNSPPFQASKQKSWPLLRCGWSNKSMTRVNLTHQSIMPLWVDILGIIVIFFSGVWWSWYVL